MAEVIFYEKPDCAANAKQKKQLEAAGHVLEVRDLMAAAWTRDSLRPFFAERPVEQWINKLHPSVRSGAVTPATLTAEQALDLMIADPSLIRRPLLQVGDERRSGYDPNGLQDWIGILPKGGDGESCDDKHAKGRCDHGHHHFPHSH